LLLWQKQQEIRTNAHETRESLAVAVRRLSWSISTRFVAIHSFAAKNRKNIAENPYFKGLRLFKVIDVDTTKSTSPVMISSMFVPMHLQAFSR